MLAIFRVLAVLAALASVAHAQIAGPSPPTPPGAPIAFATGVPINATGDAVVIPITVPNVSYVVVTGVIITNASATPGSTDSIQIWTGPSASGTQLFTVGLANLNALSSPTLAALLLSATSTTIQPVLVSGTDNLYFNVSAADPNPITVDVYVFGVAIPYF